MIPVSADRRTLEEALTPDVLALIKRSVQARVQLSARHVLETRPKDAAHAHVLLLNHQARADELQGLFEDPITYFCPPLEDG